jgi:hypothetical protein
MQPAGLWVIGFIVVCGALILLSNLIRTVNRPPFSWLRRILETPMGIPLPARDKPGELYYRPYPRRLSLNWIAMILGPIYYTLVGLWTHASIMLILILLSGGLLAPLVWLYCGLKANEDVLEFRVARDSVY